ncbi:MAG: histidine phosphatase family protein [Mariprofundaceae bacterium]|nr:histidine phosphatase family protein [Mariprofundaceae bacterium]
MLTIDLLRHGATQASPQHLYGATDVPLSQEGEQQLKQAWASVSQDGISNICTSPLQRCTWLPQHVQHQAKVVVEDAFSEMNFGAWEGQSIVDLRLKGVDLRGAMQPLLPPDGESWAVFSARVLQAWQDYVQQHLQQGGHHLLLSHGGVMRVILAAVLHIPDAHVGKLYIPHATWSRVTCVEGEPPVLWFMNRHA